MINTNIHQKRGSCIRSLLALLLVCSVLFMVQISTASALPHTDDVMVVDIDYDTSSVYVTLSSSFSDLQKIPLELIVLSADDTEINTYEVELKGMSTETFRFDVSLKDPYEIVALLGTGTTRFNDAYTILSKLEGKITAADSETNKVTIVLDMDPTDVKIGSKVKVTLEQ